MRIVKGILKTVFWILILALLVMPVALIYKISNEEMKEYEPPKPPVLQETAYGSVAKSYRTDVYESITISGTMVSNTYQYMELTQKEPGSIRWEVYTGDEIQEGQVIGTYKGQNVVSTVTGVLVSNNAYGSDPYLKVRLLEPLELECRVTDRILNVLKREGVALTTKEGEVVTLLHSNLVKNGDGTTTVRLHIDSDSYYYGQVVEKLNILTGSSYLKTLVLDKDCVYQKNLGEDEPWYVRKVTEEGHFIAEVEVSIGYETDDVVCISGIEEGEYFDSGYKTIIGGK